MPLKYVGRTVEIIYQDRHGKLTQRKIVVRSIRDGKVSAYDVTNRSYRVFKIANILAVRLARSA